MGEGCGTITWWGFSPAFDLLEKDVTEALSAASLSEGEGATDVNVLLVGAADARHILSTISHAYTYPHKNIHFYVIESSLEVMARQFLLIALALEHPDRISLQERTEVFMELYGNLLTRHQTMEYLTQMANLGIKFVTDSDYLEEKMPVIDFSNLRFKERDFMEAIMKFWRNGKKEHFDAPHCWDLRMRNLLKTRYDTRRNAFDWDFSFTLKDRKASIIGSHLYLNWRETGVAFEPREADYDVPNRSLASGLVIKHDGERHHRRGYWGDVVTGPFVTYGLVCENQDMFKTYNGQFTSNSETITQYNLTALLHEILHGQKYVAPPEEAPEQQEQTPKLEEITEEEEVDEQGKEADGETDKQTEAVKPLDKPYESLPVPNVKVHFMPLGFMEDMVKKAKYQNFFDYAFFGTSLVSTMKPDMKPVLKPTATVAVENARFILELGSDKLPIYREKMENMAAEIGLKPTEPLTDDQDVFFFKATGDTS